VPERLTRKNLEDHVAELLWKGHKTRADVKLVRLDGRQYVVKDYAWTPSHMFSNTSKGFR
jgi:hypothetical protein